MTLVHRKWKILTKRHHHKGELIAKIVIIKRRAHTTLLECLQKLSYCETSVIFNMILKLAQQLNETKAVYKFAAVYVYMYEQYVCMTTVEIIQNLYYMKLF